MSIKVIKREDESYPKQLSKIKQPPEKLYVLGDEKILQNQSIAIVGARRCSEYGVKYAKQFAKEIAEKGITIISGLALGIDTVAHEASKSCKGKTIAVVGCGFNYIYPIENKELFKSILTKGGCILSEYEPDIPLNMQNFPKRNRIISGLADGVLVIEAGYRSGSVITGNLALEQGKKLFCIPRNLGETKGIGTNELIKKGAKLVTCPQEILKEYDKKEIMQKEETAQEQQEYIKKAEKGKKESKINKTKENHNKDIISVPKEYMNIYQFISYTPQNIQYFSKQTGLKIAEVTQKLIMLELQGYIKSMPRKLLYQNIKKEIRFYKGYRKCSKI